MTIELLGSLTTTSQKLRKREISSTELVNTLLRRIDDWNPRLNALSCVLAELAKKEATQADQRRFACESLGELDGVPVVIKDIIDTSPAVCSAGLPFLADYRPVKDSIVVKQLRQAGAIILGVSTTDPGAFGVRTPVVIHPQAPDRNVGGSSGGSAAALAGCFCSAAIGTDTGGSIRIPSACCLIVGFKPSIGRVSTVGIRPLAWSLDHVGPMARNVRDLTIVERIIDPRFDKTTGERIARSIVVGHDPNYYRDAVHEVLVGMNKVLKLCQEMGIRIQEVSIPDPDDAQGVYGVIFCSESSAYHFETFPSQLLDYSVVAQEVMQRAKELTGYQYVQAIRRRSEMKQRMADIFDKVNFVLIPSLPILAPKREVETVEIGGVERSITLTLIRYTCLFDLTGNPVVSLPVSVISPGLGVSIQVVGATNNDADTLSFAERIEQRLELKIDYQLRI